MKHLRETFTDQEFEALKQAKENFGVKQNWHDLIYRAVLYYSITIGKSSLEMKPE
jgi:hypothetical protein